MALLNWSVLNSAPQFLYTGSRINFGGGDMTCCYFNYHYGILWDAELSPDFFLCFSQNTIQYIEVDMEHPPYVPSDNQTWQAGKPTFSSMIVPAIK